MILIIIFSENNKEIKLINNKIHLKKFEWIMRKPIKIND